MKYTDIKEVKKELLKAIKYKEDFQTFVKIYECEEDEQNVEVILYIDDEFEESWILDIFQLEEIKDARKRAKQVHKSISKWSVNLHNDIEEYTV